MELKHLALKLTPKTHSLLARRAASELRTLKAQAELIISHALTCQHRDLHSTRQLQTKEQRVGK